MKIIIPKNIYSAIFALSLPEEFRNSITVESASLISRELENGNADIGLMPSLDLLQHKDLYISKKIGLSFDGILSTSYLHLIPDCREFKDVFLHGDVSTNEIILTKILFSERFNSKVDIHLNTNPVEQDSKNYIISGSETIQNDSFEKGISFSDQIAEMLDNPYVNFVLAAKDEGKLKEFTDKLVEFDKHIEDNIETYLDKINESTEVSEFIRLNLNSVYYEITENEVEALSDLIRLPFYHGMVEELFDLKWV